ncbi:MAG: toprim domain-containing protein, partial [Alphaproteobacteria bacterium]
KMLYGLAHARRGAAERGQLIVVEGYMDVIALHQAGFNEAVAPLGTALTEAQLAVLWRLVDEPILCFDGDAAGERAAGRAAERALALLKPGKSLRFVRLPAGEDPDTLLQQQGPAALRELLAAARPLVDLVWELEVASQPADTPERKARLKERIELTVRRIADDAVQRGYRQELWARFRQRFDAAPEKGGFARREERRPGARGPGSWRKEPPAAGLGGPRDVRSLMMRHRQGLIAAVVNHPGLLDEVGELFGALELPAGELDKLRQEIIKTWAPDIDSGALKNHLMSSGYGGILDRVLTPEVYTAAPFANPALALAAAAKGWRHSYELLARRRARLEIDAAEREHAEQMSEESLTRLRALQRQVESDELKAVELERDELLLRKTKAR